MVFRRFFFVTCDEFAYDMKRFLACMSAIRPLISEGSHIPSSARSAGEKASARAISERNLFISYANLSQVTNFCIGIPFYFLYLSKYVTRKQLVRCPPSPYLQQIG